MICDTAYLYIYVSILCIYQLKLSLDKTKVLQLLPKPKHTADSGCEHQLHCQSPAPRPPPCSFRTYFIKQLQHNSTNLNYITQVGHQYFLQSYSDKTTLSGHALESGSGCHTVLIAIILLDQAGQ